MFIDAYIQRNINSAFPSIVCLIQKNIIKGFHIRKLLIEHLKTF